MVPQDTQSTISEPVTEADKKPISYGELFLTFLKAGCLGFGGFFSLISVVESILVEKKKLLTSEEMLDGISLASLLPGPQAVNVVAYAGNRLRGTWGAIIAAVAVILPSFVLMVVLSILYQRYGQNAEVKQFFKGFVPAVCAVIASVAWRMAQKNIKGAVEFILMAIAIGGLIFIPQQFRLYATFILVVFFGVVGYIAFLDKKAASLAPRAVGKFPLKKTILALGMVLILVVALYLPVAEEAYKSLYNLVKTFSGLSVMLFGGGYVIIPIMRHHVVEIFGWLSKQAFTEGIAFSQVMPGPILIAATFIGYQVHGFTGALLSTVAIFTPPAIVMVVASQGMEYFKKSITAKAIMRGIRCGVIGMIFFAAFELGSKADYHSFATIWPSIVIFTGALFVLIRYNVDVVYIIPTAGLIGYFLYPH